MRNLWMRFIALVRRTFVTDCPRCFKYFYGFNKYALQVIFGEQAYRIVCHKCAEEHSKLEKKAV